MLTALVYCRIKKADLAVFLDTALPAVALGQAVGRWGNFFNREAFGRYTDSLFAMQLPLQAVAESAVTDEMLDHLVTIDDIRFIQVHPTFLYESVWDLCLLAVLLAVTFHVKNRRKGEIALLYVTGYALGRVWIEGLRTDQLKIAGTGIAVSQLLSAVLAVTGAAALTLRHMKRMKP